MATALLWIAIRRVDSSVTVEDIRDLPPEVFQMQDGDARPPAETVVERNSSDSTSGDDSETTSEDPETIPAISGVPG